MKKPILLCDCNNKLDAFFLKNIIQKIATIPVLIVRKKKKLQLFVENSNFYKASMILVNQKTTLPSAIKAKRNFFSNVADETNNSISTFKEKVHKLEEQLLNLFTNNHQQSYKRSLETIRVISQDSYSRRYPQK